jgi:hypothetical protein
MNFQFRRHNNLTALCFVALALAHYGCGAETNRANEMQTGNKPQAAVTRETFGQLADGTQVDAFTLTNANGVVVRAITYGGIITSLRVPDRDGRIGDVVLGYDSLEGYLEENPYFGPILRRDHWPLRQPHRGRPFHDRRTDLHSGDQQRTQPSPRRHQRLRQGRMGCGAVRERRQRGRNLLVYQPRW